MPERLLVVDTHVWIWTVAGYRDRLSQHAIERIEAASLQGTLRVCAISVWEVAMLEAKGRLSLSSAVTDWINAALRAPGLSLLELSPSIAAESTRLPGEFPGDPADRIIAASTRSVGGVLATADRALIRYAGNGSLSVLDVTR